VLSDVIDAAQLLKQERKKLTSNNLVLLLVHDLLLADGIQAGDGPIKQAILRHRTRLRGEFEKKKIKLGVSKVEDLVQTSNSRTGSISAFHQDFHQNFSGLIPRYVRVNTLKCSLADIVSAFISQGYVLTSRPSDR
jgi:25S rRNA (cytosine2278-C5)-methyltransferase